MLILSRTMLVHTAQKQDKRVDSVGPGYFNDFPNPLFG